MHKPLEIAKTYDGSCALGPAIRLTEPAALTDLTVQVTIERGGAAVFEGETRTSQMKRSLEELVAYLGRELSFPHGVLLMTGTGIVPGDDFTLQSGDRVIVAIGDLTLANPVA